MCSSKWIGLLALTLGVGILIAVAVPPVITVCFFALIFIGGGVIILKK